MTLRAKVLALLVPAALVSTFLTAAVARRSVEAVLTRSAAARAELAASELARQPELARGLSAGDELGLLSLLAAARDVSGAAYVCLLDPRGRVVAHTDLSQKGRIYGEPGAREALAAAGPFSRPLRPEGRRLVEAVQPVEEPPAAAAGEAFLLSGGRRRRSGTLLLALPLDRTLAAANLISRRLTAIVAGANALALVLALLGLRRVLEPVRLLAGATERLRGGALGASVAVTSEDELGELARAFNRMSAELEQTTVSRRFLDDILTQMTEALLVAAPDGVVRLANPAAGALLGRPCGELLGRPLSALFARPRLFLRDGAADAALASGALSNVEGAVNRPDATEVPVLAGAAVYRDSSGAVSGVILTLRDITERKRAEEELARQAAELARSNAELEGFAYIASHDLQEPLRKVAGFAELLGHRCRRLLDEKAAGYLGCIVDGAARMRRMIEDLLLYARAGRGTLRLEGVDLGRVLDRVESTLEPALRESGAVVIRGPLAVLTGDALQLEQLLQNLLSNAVKFRGPDPPRIRVEAEESDRLWVVTVSDNGIGIEPRHGREIFEPFTRLEEAAGRPGSGIGLAICRRILERHGGRIWLDAAPGRGATFRFSLPKRGPPPRAPRLRLSRENR